MKANELMIGDKITFKDSLQSDKTPLVVEIKALGYQDNSENSALVSIGGDSTFDVVEINDECVGIPLAPEILEKNGFYKGAKGSEHREEFAYIKEFDNDVLIDFSIRIIFFSSWIMVECCNYNNKGRYFRSEISFVSELQHALRLCGIDKEITL